MPVDPSYFDTMRKAVRIFFLHCEAWDQQIGIDDQTADNMQRVQPRQGKIGRQKGIRGRIKTVMEFDRILEGFKRQKSQAAEN